MARKKKSGTTREIDEKDLDRFAGSSDEEEEETHEVKQVESDADDEVSEGEREEEMADEKKESDHDSEDAVGDDEFYVTNEKKDHDPAEKMSAAISRILGSSAPKTSTVLAKTVTPLQRLQIEEKERQKALREKRLQKKERNLAAFHIPLSVATTNKPLEGRASISKELSQERFHRRVATRGVVALFNAISQHQLPAESRTTSTTEKSNSGTSKLTKHMFLDKIKNSAAEKRSQGDLSRSEKKVEKPKPAAPVWDSLKDDYMMKSKPNWDEESSDGDENEAEEPPEDEIVSLAKKRKVRSE